MKNLFTSRNFKIIILLCFLLTGILNKNLQIKHFYLIIFCIYSLYWSVESYLELINKRLDLIDQRIKVDKKKTEQQLKELIHLTNKYVNKVNE